MSSTKQVTLTFTADAAGLQAALARINGDLGKLQGQGEAAGKGITKGLEAADKTLNQTGSNAMKLGGALSAISPEAAGMAQGLGKLAQAAEVAALAQSAMAGGIGAVTVAIKAQVVAMATNPVFLGVVAGIAAVGAAYHLLSTEVDEATKKMDAAAATATRASQGYDSFADQVRAIATDNKLARGETDKGTVALLQQLDALKGAYEATKRLDKETGASEEIVKAHRKAYVAATAQLYETDRLTREHASTLGTTTVATKADAAATRDRAAALKAASAAVREAQALDAARLQTSTDLINSVQVRGQTAREAIVQEARAEDAKFTKQQRLYAKDSGAYAELQEAKLKARQQYADKLQALDDQEAAEAAARDAAELAQIQQKHVEALNVAQQTSSAIIGLAQTVLQAELANIDTSTNEGKKAAQKRWDAQYALSVAEAVLNAALGVSAQLATGNIPGAIVAGVMGAIAVASVVASPPPKLHTGGMAPDETPATLRAGEAVLSGQGRRTLGDATINAANAGQQPASSAGRGVVVYKHRAFEYFIADHLGMDGTLARTIRGGDRVGQLRRGRA